MKLKEGRMGVLEGSAAATVALTVNGIFSTDAKYAYSEGNSTYVWVPASILLSLIPVFVLSYSMERRSCGDLAEYADRTCGKAMGGVAVALIVAGLIYCAAKPFTCFLEVLHRLVFDGVSYNAVLAFIFPVTVFAALKGFECIGRLAAVFDGLLLISILTAIASAAPTYESYRLYPLMGDGALSLLRSTASQTLAALPPLLGLLASARGLNGIRYARKCAAASALISAFICGAVQLALGLTYTYKTLSGLLMPLYRINFLSLSQNYALRLDKLFIMVWLCGCVISSAYCIYCAARLHAGFFRSRDADPPLIAFSAVVCALMLAAYTKKYEAVSLTEHFTVRYGAAFVALPVIALASAGIIKRRVAL